MKAQMFKILALLTLFMGCGVSCSSDLDIIQNDTFAKDLFIPQDQEKFQPTDAGTKSSSFSIDNNFISISVPYLVSTEVTENPPRKTEGNPFGLTPHVWTILLVFAEGTDVTKLSLNFTLESGVIISSIKTATDTTTPVVLYDFSKVYGNYDYTKMIAGEYNFSKILGDVFDFTKQVNFVVIAPDGSTVTYLFLAYAIGDKLPYH